MEGRIRRIRENVAESSFNCSKNIFWKFIMKNMNSKYFVNLQGIAKNKLENEGIVKKHIKVSKDCTFCKFERYFSFRREGDNSGRMFGLIGVKNNIT